MQSSETPAATAAAAPMATARPPRRWDPLVRLTHWGVAAAIVANGLFTEEGSAWHVWVGYAAGALLALRLAWGFIGPREARFSAFPPSPGRAIAHVREIAAGEKREHPSHNPLGALMVYALWATLAVVVGTGVAMSGPPPSVAALTQPQASGEHEDEDGERGEGGEHDEAVEAGERGEGGGEEAMEEIHEVAANLLFVLAALHVAGVAFETRRMGPQILTSMTGGGRRRRNPQAGE
jgi:cytochrome b